MSVLVGFTPSPQSQHDYSSNATECPDQSTTLLTYNFKLHSGPFSSLREIILQRHLMQGALLHACKGCSSGLGSCHCCDDGHLVRQSKPAQVLAIHHIHLFTCKSHSAKVGAFVPICIYLSLNQMLHHWSQICRCIYRTANAAPQHFKNACMQACCKNHDCTLQDSDSLPVEVMSIMATSPFLTRSPMFGRPSCIFSTTSHSTPLALRCLPVPPVLSMLKPKLCTHHTAVATQLLACFG